MVNQRKRRRVRGAAVITKRVSHRRNEMRIKKRVRTGLLFTVLLLSFAVMAIVAEPVHANEMQYTPLDFTNENTPATGPGWS